MKMGKKKIGRSKRPAYRNFYTKIVDNIPCAAYNKGGLEYLSDILYLNKEAKAMATQIAPTPVVRGQAATVIYKEMRRKPTQASKRGAKILISKFSKMVK